jgi:hypothetical protein
MAAKGVTIVGKIKKEMSKISKKSSKMFPKESLLGSSSPQPEILEKKGSTLKITSKKTKSSIPAAAVKKDDKLKSKNSKTLKAKAAE